MKSSGKLVPKILIIGILLVVISLLGSLAFYTVYPNLEFSLDQYFAHSDYRANFNPQLTEYQTFSHISLKNNSDYSIYLTVNQHLSYLLFQINLNLSSLHSPHQLLSTSISKNVSNLDSGPSFGNLIYIKLVSFHTFNSSSNYELNLQTVIFSSSADASIVIVPGDMQQQLDLVQGLMNLFLGFVILSIIGMCIVLIVLITNFFRIFRKKIYLFSSKSIQILIVICLIMGLAIGPLFYYYTGANSNLHRELKTIANTPVFNHSMDLSQKKSYNLGNISLNSQLYYVFIQSSNSLLNTHWKLEVNFSLAANTSNTSIIAVDNGPFYYNNDVVFNGNYYYPIGVFNSKNTSIYIVHINILENTNISFHSTDNLLIFSYNNGIKFAYLVIYSIDLVIIEVLFVIELLVIINLGLFVILNYKNKNKILANPNVIHCPQCSYPNYTDVRNCAYCGFLIQNKEGFTSKENDGVFSREKLDESYNNLQSITCSNCHALNTQESKYCYQCGFKINNK